MMITVLESILFSESLSAIEQKLRLLKKDVFEDNDRVIIKQDIEDSYPYVDSAGVKLIEIQKIINQVDIPNYFVLLVTPNPDIESEIKFITEYYSVDSTPINFTIRNGKYKKEVVKYNDTACKKLWNHLYVGTDNNINPCCLADHKFPLGSLNVSNTVDDIINSKKSNQIRQWMKEGYRPAACQTCYTKEDNNIPSARIPFNDFDQGINITILDIRINNICNFKCRMCSEYFSSAIQQETIKLYGKDAVLGHEQNLMMSSSLTERRKQLDKVMPYISNKIENIYFAGGEPLITDEHYQILDKLIDINHTNLQLRYNTNLSTLIYKNNNVIDYWNQFSDVEVGASVDASDAVAEYVRHGTVWTEIVENINKIKKQAPNVKLKITSTVSFLTIENLISLQNKWIDEKIFKIDDLSLNVLINPSYLSPAALPQHHKDRLSKSISNHIDRFGGTRLAERWQDVLSYMMNNDSTHTLSDFVQRTRVLDTHRKESFINVFPEFHDLLCLK